MKTDIFYTQPDEETPYAVGLPGPGVPPAPAPALARLGRAAVDTCGVPPSATESTVTEGAPAPLCTTPEAASPTGMAPAAAWRARPITICCVTNSCMAYYIALVLVGYVHFAHVIQVLRVLLRLFW